MVAVKNSIKRQPARSPARAIAAGNRLMPALTRVCGNSSPAGRRERFMRVKSLDVDSEPDGAYVAGISTGHRRHREDCCRDRRLWRLPHPHPYWHLEGSEGSICPCRYSERTATFQESAFRSQDSSSPSSDKSSSAKAHSGETSKF